MRDILIGIGNNSRGDDGLGWAFLDAVAGQFSGRVEYRYQLAVEDAELLTRFDRVLFVDACVSSLPNGYVLEPCLPVADGALYTHQQTPGAILYLCQDLYGHQPEAWCLQIQGHIWEFGTGLSDKARKNLERAVAGYSVLSIPR